MGLCSLKQGATRGGTELMKLSAGGERVRSRETQTDLLLQHMQLVLKEHLVGPGNT